MFAGADDREIDLGVSLGNRQVDDDSHFGGRQQLVDRAGARNPVLFGGGLGAGEVDVGASNDIEVRELLTGR